MRVELVVSLMAVGRFADCLSADGQGRALGSVPAQYEVACDVLGADHRPLLETLAQSAGPSVPDAAAVERIEAAKRALRLERDELDTSNAEAIKAVVRKYGPRRGNSTKRDWTPTADFRARKSGWLI